jgi:hypothetical protein
MTLIDWYRGQRMGEMIRQFGFEAPDDPNDTPSQRVHPEGSPLFFSVLLA